jgi:acetoacetyl-CoA synthetase
VSATVPSVVHWPFRERVPQIRSFREAAGCASGQPIESPAALHAWSVGSYRDFWRTFLDW